MVVNICSPQLSETVTSVATLISEFVWGALSCSEEGEGSLELEALDTQVSVIVYRWVNGSTGMKAEPVTDGMV